MPKLTIRAIRCRRTDGPTPYKKTWLLINISVKNNAIVIAGYNKVHKLNRFHFLQVYTNDSLQSIQFYQKKTEEM